MAQKTLTDHLPGVNKTAIERPGAIYSLATTGLLRPSRILYDDLKSALRLNEPSKADHKLDTGAKTPSDPIIDHLMSSKALRGVIRSFVVVLLLLGVAIMIMAAMGGGGTRLDVLQFGGPLVGCYVPVALLLIMPFSQRSR